MAEDDMLLNFAVDDRLAKAAPRFRGGSWRDRIRANKSVQRLQARPPLPLSREIQPRIHKEKAADDTFTNSRPAKRRRDHGEFSSRAPQDESHDLDQGKRLHDQTQYSRRPREVISSLFTYNPTSSEPSKVADTTATKEPSRPSNAPLPDGIDTFTSLGLSQTLAAHLMTKMELKNPTAIQKIAITQLLKENSDAFVQSETGSGKTLAYLLPVVQQVMSLSQKNNLQNRTPGVDGRLHRDSGLFAIILAPTRELCKQISVVLERVLVCAHYIVAGTVMGGEKKKSEKARLRKGLNILVSTPGRLVDHFDNTKVLDLSCVRWLVLDEGDRLMDLGFEYDISKIVKTLDQRQKDGQNDSLPSRRSTILCSATMKMNVQKLGEISLKDAVLIKGETEDEVVGAERGQKESAFLAPAQLKQSYIIVPAKQRFVALTALLRRAYARKGSVMKAIVFVSCADSVEFHFRAFTRNQHVNDQDLDPAAVSSTQAEDETAEANENASIAPSPQLSSASNALTVYKLHGSLPQTTRTQTVKAFSQSTDPSLLIATDVASRGLDLPNLDLVIEHDPPFSADDHLHRVGRTARLGRDGRAVIILLPGPEEGYVEVLKRSYKSSIEGATAVTQQTADEILQKGFSPTSGVVAGTNWHAKAEQFQLELERWVLASSVTRELARRAFQSHVRAYATHVSDERKWFDIKLLHLGHLAKAFGLRDAPGQMNVKGMRGDKAGGKQTGKRRVGNGGGGRDKDGLHAAGQGFATKKEKVMNETTVDAQEAARKMKEKIRGSAKKMMGGGADEFNIA